MLELARPGFLLAGALLALVPPLLHLIARRPPERMALPTARFLRPDPRTSVRIRRRPTNLLLLLLRSALLLLIGFGVAGPSWAPVRAGTVELVLLDRGRGMADVWTAAVDSARTILLSDGGARGELVLFDTSAVRLTELSPVRFDSLAGAGPGAASVDYAAAFRGVSAALRARSDADSVRVTLVTRPRWEGWSPGLSRVRRASWPGAIRVIELAANSSPAPAATWAGPAQARRRAVVLAEPGGGAYAAAALGALGWEVASRDADGGMGTELYVVLRGLAEEEEAALLERARAGATAVVAGVRLPGTLGVALPWHGVAGAEPSGRELPDARYAGTLVFASGPAVAGVSRRVGGTVKSDARVLAAWADGRPAAGASRFGAGCLVYLSAPLEGGRFPRSPEFPDAVRRLASACDGRGATSRIRPAGVENSIRIDGNPPWAEAEATPQSSASVVPPWDVRPLDSGALAVLEGAGAPTTLSAAAVAARARPAEGDAGEGPAGRPLGRWALLAALSIAVVETLLVYRRRRT